MECDVCIVGAGPAGLAAAITSAANGLKTILLEKSTEIGFPVKTSAVTWREVIDEWQLPDNVMYQWYDSFYINSLHSKKDVEICFNEKPLGTLNYHVFLRELACRAVSVGAKLQLANRVSEPIIDGDTVVGVKTKNKEIHAKIVLDCSGSQGVIGKYLDLLPKQKDIELGIGIEYEMANVNVRNPDALEFYVGEPDIVPIGYGWIFPITKKRAKVGICTVYNTPEILEEKNIQYWFDRFLSENSPIYPMIKDAQPYELHMGSYPLSGMLEKPYANGLLIAGDAAAQASMLIGEGIRYAMEFGKRASLISYQAIKHNNTSEDFLKKYSSSCKEYLGETFNVAIDLLQVPTNEYWDILVENIIRLKKEKKPELIKKYLKTTMKYSDAKQIFPEFVEKYL